MNWLNQLNPAKHLFLKVFLYFWLAAVLIVASTLWLAKQLNSEEKYQPLNANQATDLQTLAQKVQFSLANKSPQQGLQPIINQVSKRQRVGLVLIDTQSREIWQRLPRNRQLDQQLFADFEPHSSSLLMRANGMLFMGPSLIKIEQSQYLLFSVKPLHRNGLGMMWQQYPALFILFICSLSAALCYWFARGLLKPILQLRNASKRMANGEMGVRVENANKRLDEIGQLSRDFNFMSLQVETLLTNQKRLLADISHELRSPLARLQLSIGIGLQHQDTTSKEMVSALGRIEKEALQIEKMLSQVLLLSKLDNQQPMQNIQQVSIEQIMQPIIADAEFEAKQKNKTLDYQAGSNISFKADVQILSSAIENIIRNAIHYSQHHIEVTVFAKDGQVVWVIEDDGNGIDESQVSRLFEAFYRESTARDRNSGGVGLGLAIAHHAIMKHQGQIQATNKAEGGLKVKVQVPL